MQKFTAEEYLQIDIANNFGMNLDKENWNVRLDWFQKNKHQLDTLLNQAEEPALFYAGVQAWKAVQRGEPIGYPISLDATASGIQISACLTGDREAAKITNVVNTGNRIDAYTFIYDAMLHDLGGSATVRREDSKRAIMTSAYGSTKVPIEVFGEGKLLQVFINKMMTHAPAVWTLNKIMLALWDTTVDMYSWVMPDNFHVNIKVMNKVKEILDFMGEPLEISRYVNAPSDYGRSLGANTIHSVDGLVVREMHRRCDYNPATVKRITQIIYNVWDKPESLTITTNLGMVLKLWQHYEQSGYLSARIIDYIDEETIFVIDRMVLNELINSLPAKPFKLLSNHDCFRVHPNYGNDLRKQYNLQLMLLAKSNLLSNILGQLIGEKFHITKQDPYLWKDVMDSDYSLS